MEAKSQGNWLKFGNRSYKYFHACASQKQYRRNIQNIQDQDGLLCSSHEEIENTFVQYFKDLFTAGENLDVGTCTRVLEPKVTPRMNQQLLATFTEEEISNALNQMAPLKALGPDGFSSCFYKQNWAVVKAEVCAAILLYDFESSLYDSESPLSD